MRTLAADLYRAVRRVALRVKVRLDEGDMLLAREKCSPVPNGGSCVAVVRTFCEGWKFDRDGDLREL